MEKDTLKYLALSTLCLFTSCTTYYLTTQSLIEQMYNTQKEKKITIGVPLVGVVDGNNLREIKVKDKSDNTIVLPVTHHTSIRITQKNGKRITFYLNTLIIKDSVITGKKDHFFGINITPIHLRDIEKIELQK